MSAYYGREFFWHRWGRTYLHVRFDRRHWLVGLSWERWLSQAGDEFSLTFSPLPTISIRVRRLYGWPDWDGVRHETR